MNRILNSLNDLENSIKDLKNDFINQLKGIDDDTNNFHKQLIELISKYPEQKDILEFVVLVNDKIETKLNNYFEIVNYVILDSLKIKANIISFLKAVELEELKKIGELEKSFIDEVNSKIEKKNVKNDKSSGIVKKIKKMDIFSLISDIKTIIVGLVIISVIVLYIVDEKKR